MSIYLNFPIFITNGDLTVCVRFSLLLSDFIWAYHVYGSYVYLYSNRPFLHLFILGCYVGDRVECT